MQDIKLDWVFMYDLAKKYYEYYDNLLIPQDFKTKNGYEYDEEGLLLGVWIHNQRNNYELLADSKKDLLEKIGFSKNSQDIVWQSNYNLARNYYEHFGNLLVPLEFKTKNGYEYDEDGINLGTWIRFQREKYKNGLLPNEYICQLEDICMVWNKWDNNKIIKMCKNYGINYNLNVRALSHISVREFAAKLCYLTSNNIDIVDEKGILHEIFYMSDIEIKNKYAYTSDELVGLMYEMDFTSILSKVKVKSLKQK